MGVGVYDLGFSLPSVRVVEPTGFRHVRESSFNKGLGFSFRSLGFRLRVYELEVCELRMGDYYLNETK